MSCSRTLQLSELVPVWQKQRCRSEPAEWAYWSWSQLTQWASEDQDVTAVSDLCIVRVSSDERPQSPEHLTWRRQGDLGILLFSHLENFSETQRDEICPAASVNVKTQRQLHKEECDWINMSCCTVWVLLWVCHCFVLCWSFTYVFKFVLDFMFLFQFC